MSTLALLCLLLAGCGQAPEVRFHLPDAYPERLSEWQLLLVDDERIALNEGVEPYDLNAALFTDYAQKLRAIYLPEGRAATYREPAPLDFPVGTVLTKTFFYPRAATAAADPEHGQPPRSVRPDYQWSRNQRSLSRADLVVLETRLLVRQADGWDALPYVWRGDDAYLTIAGALERMQIVFPDGHRQPLPYIVPTRNECAACHATDHTIGALEPIGPAARHLNRGYLGGPGNQLTRMAESGRLDGLPPLAEIPSNADPAGDAPIDAKARAYLDINCGHCHSRTGAADTSGLMLDAGAASSRALGVCKPPIAAGRGTGGHSYSIVPGAPDRSILVFRMETDDPGSRMPELGRSLAHREGVRLISAWIEQMEGACIERAGGRLTGD